MYKKIYNKIYALIKTGLRFFSVLLFSFIILYVQALNFANSFETDTIGCNDKLIHQSGYFAKYNSNPIQTYLFEVLLVLNETENIEEDEVNEVSANKYKNCLSNFYTGRNVCSASVKNLIHQSILSILNRSTVAIFILIHSWKSYLFS